MPLWRPRDSGEMGRYPQWNYQSWSCIPAGWDLAGYSWDLLQLIRTKGQFLTKMIWGPSSSMSHWTRNRGDFSSLRSSKECQEDLDIPTMWSQTAMGNVYSRCWQKSVPCLCSSKKDISIYIFQWSKRKKKREYHSVVCENYMKFKCQCP